MSGEEGASVLKRLSMNARLSRAKIFDDDSSEDDSKQGYGKVKKSKKNVKKSPYKVNITKSKIEHEKDPEVLERRQKQIDYGKNTVGYDNYRQLIPMKKRLPEHPRTPVKSFKYSRRGWDGLIRNWRQKLHQFDPDGDKACANDIDINMDVKDIKSEKNFLEFV